MRATSPSQRSNTPAENCHTTANTSIAQYCGMSRKAEFQDADSVGAETKTHKQERQGFGKVGVDQLGKFPTNFFEGNTPKKFSPILLRFASSNRQPPNIFDEPQPEELLFVPVLDQISNIAA